MASFETVADEYDAARPEYPAAVFEALAPVEGLLVLDIGAGTGIATRALLDRGANVIAVDRGPEVLRRAVRRSPGVPALVADGAVLPVRDASIDLVCFAQSWHWLDGSKRVAEASHSYIISLPPAPRAELLGDLRRLLDRHFPDGAMAVSYETWMWTAAPPEAALSRPE